MVSAMSVKQFSNLAGVSTRTVLRWVRQGKIPTIRLGERVIRIPRDAVEKIMTDGLPGRDGK